jgi:uncharacterized cofD-like protein
MTQEGETTGYSVSDHINAIHQVSQGKIFDAVLAQRKPPSPNALKHYALENSHPVFLDREEIARMGYRVVLANVMQEENNQVRHDCHRLARVLLRWYSGK